MIWENIFTVYKNNCEFYSHKVLYFHLIANHFKYTIIYYACSFYDIFFHFLTYKLLVNNFVDVDLKDLIWFTKA